MKDHISEKLEQFEREILVRVTREKELSDSEVEQFQAGELEKYQSVALENSFGMIQSEVARQESDLNKIAAEKISHYRRLLFQRREAYSHEIFDQVREALAAFSAVDPITGGCNEEYKQFLLKTAAQLGAASTPNAGTVLLVRQEDLPLEQELKQAFSKPCRVEESKTIRLGGLFVENRTEGYQEDKTLESSLEEQFQWFHDHSKMMIQL